jgi:hypothetical protein
MVSVFLVNHGLINIDKNQSDISFDKRRLSLDLVNIITKDFIQKIDERTNSFVSSTMYIVSLFKNDCIVL